MKKKLAENISAIINPILVSLVAIALLSYESTASNADAIKWAAILLFLCVVPVYLTAVVLVRMGRLEGIFNNTREKREQLYLVACMCAGAALLVLHLMGAPEQMVATMTATLVAGITFALINLKWKISIHTAFITGFVVLAILLYGWLMALLGGLVIVVAWSRVELDWHTGRQVIAGMAATIIIMSVNYSLFGLI
jgi:membrane-associated phospholipid phosphatase